MTSFWQFESTVAAGSANQDRIEVQESNGRQIIVVADGAGGVAGGAQAAELLMSEVRTRWQHVQTPNHAIACLRSIDLKMAQMGTGQTTATVVTCIDISILVASVGDSEAWLIGTSSVIDLTEGQIRKPLLGSGTSEPVAATHLVSPGVGVLLIATDGLFKYASRSTIHNVVRNTNLADIPQALVSAVRLPSGKLQDDIAVVVGGRLPVHVQ
jgi:PPM family protein phosphatase